MSYPIRRWTQGRGGFADLDALRAEIGRVLGSTVGGWGGAFSPDVDVDEGDQAWTVTVRLPGVAPEEAIVELDGRDLLVRARHEEEDDGGARRAAFQYRVTVPSDVNPDDVDATMDHGLLTVRLPRRGLPQGRRIAVTSRSGPGPVTGDIPTGIPNVVEAPEVPGTADVPGAPGVPGAGRVTGVAPAPDTPGAIGGTDLPPT